MTPRPTDPKLATKVTPGAPAPTTPKCPAPTDSAPFGIVLAYNNYRAPIQPIPAWIRMRHGGPVWMNELGGNYGFFTTTRGADIGKGASDQATIKAALDFAAAVPTQAVVDIERYWPSGPAVGGEQQWWYGGVGKVLDHKLAICAEKSSQAGKILDAIRAARKDAATPIGVNVPNSIWDRGNEAFQKIIVKGFVGPLIERVEFLTIDVYPHPIDTTPALYGARVENVIDAYARHFPEKELWIYVWPSCPHAKADPVGYLRAAIGAARLKKIAGAMIWDHPDEPWPAWMTQEFRVSA